MAVHLITETLVDPGNQLQISGIIPEEAYRIEVGLNSGSNDWSFYMDVRFHNNTVVFNTKEDGKWGERTVQPNPYKQGGAFEVTVDYTGQNYVVKMEGKTYEFDNRLKTVKTKHIKVKGDLELQAFTLKPSNEVVPSLGCVSQKRSC